MLDLATTLNSTSPPASAAALLSIQGLTVSFPIRSGWLQRVSGRRVAVDGVSLDIAKGESLGLVGESGSGKSTVGRAIVRLTPVETGTIRFDGRDVLAARGAALLAFRRRVQMVFQDPGGSLDPRMRIQDSVLEPLAAHGVGTRGDRRHQAAQLLARVGLPDLGSRYPHQLSGGQRQRVVIARALALSPQLLICDEPTSALDVSIQAQIVNLLMDLKAELGLTLLFISHDLAVVQHVCDRIAVMQGGRIVEIGTREEILTAPREVYTRRLLEAVPERPQLQAQTPVESPA